MVRRETQRKDIQGKHRAVMETIWGAVAPSQGLPRMWAQRKQESTEGTTLSVPQSWTSSFNHETINFMVFKSRALWTFIVATLGSHYSIQGRRGSSWEEAFTSSRKWGRQEIFVHLTWLYIAPTCQPWGPGLQTTSCVLSLLLEIQQDTKGHALASSFPIWFRKSVFQNSTVQTTKPTHW